VIRGYLSRPSEVRETNGQDAESAGKLKFPLASGFFTAKLVETVRGLEGRGAKPTKDKIGCTG
jgi:hypothetical protein